jgi:hypothetical protein
VLILPRPAIAVAASLGANPPWLVRLDKASARIGAVPGSADSQKSNARHCTPAVSHLCTQYELVPGGAQGTSRVIAGNLGTRRPTSGAVSWQQPALAAPPTAAAA